MRVRVIKKADGFYYPQYRFLFAWIDYTEGYAGAHIKCATLTEAIQHVKPEPQPNIVYLGIIR